MKADPNGGAGSRGGRTRAREVAFRAVFESDHTGEDPVEILELALGRFRFTQDGRGFALRLAAGAAERKEEVDAILDSALVHWALSRLSSVVRGILRLGVVELLTIPESPSRVVVQEAVRLADRYGEPDAGSFVNGVLDAVARRLRPGDLER